MRHDCDSYAWWVREEGCLCMMDKSLQDCQMVSLEKSPGIKA